MKTNSQEWKLETSAFRGKYVICHMKCGNMCKMPFHTPIGTVEVYHCVGCNKKAPSHIIIQANILNGD